jgi:hypothetical protein
MNLHNNLNLDNFTIAQEAMGDHEFNRVDKEAPPWECESFKIRSLWEMLRFYAHGFVKISEILSRINHTIFMMKKFPEDAVSKTDIFIPDFEKELIWLHETLLGLNLTIAAKSAERFLFNLKNETISGDILEKLSDELIGRVSDELESQLIFMIPSSNARYYNPEIIIFGNVIVDIVEAGNCFALGRYTACVFHLMRVMESAVQRFGKKLRIAIDPKEETWYKILQHVDKAIKALPENNLKEKTKKQNYAATSAHLDNVRRVWRNDVMHPKATFTSDEAEDILSTVRIFIRDLITIL